MRKQPGFVKLAYKYIIDGCETQQMVNKNKLLQGLYIQSINYSGDKSS